MILEFPHFGFGVPRFPWAGEVVEVQGGAGRAGRLSCLSRCTFPTRPYIATILWLWRVI